MININGRWTLLPPFSLIHSKRQKYFGLMGLYYNTSCEKLDPKHLSVCLCLGAPSFEANYDAEHTCVLYRTQAGDPPKSVSFFTPVLLWASLNLFLDLIWGSHWGWYWAPLTEKAIRAFLKQQSHLARSSFLLYTDVHKSWLGSRQNKAWWMCRVALCNSKKNVVLIQVWMHYPILL